MNLLLNLTKDKAYRSSMVDDRWALQSMVVWYYFRYVLLPNRSNHSCVRQPIFDPKFLRTRGLLPTLSHISARNREEESGASRIIGARGASNHLTKLQYNHDVQSRPFCTRNRGSRNSARISFNDWNCSSRGSYTSGRDLTSEMRRTATNTQRTEKKERTPKIYLLLTLGFLDLRINNLGVRWPIEGSRSPAERARLWSVGCSRSLHNWSTRIPGGEDQVFRICWPPIIEWWIVHHSTDCLAYGFANL